MRNVFVGLVASLLLACGGSQNREVRDYLPVIQSGLAFGSVTAGTLADLEIREEDWRSCVAYTTLESALMSASTVSGPIFPAVDLDVSECLSFNPDFTPGVADEDLIRTVSSVTDAVLHVASSLLMDVPCPERSTVQAALDFVRSAVPVAVAEITSPDGIVTIPEVSVGECVE